ncbi:MAG: helix-turn-helix domain-containing protein [Pseudonocardiaceae bacterium]
MYVRDLAREVRSLVTSSGLTAAQFAEQLGTSASRLSTYSSGKVSPSAALMVRMRRVAQSAPSEAGPDN